MKPDDAKFAIRFAHALVKLRDGAENDAPVSLTAPEAAAVVEGLRLLQGQGK